MTVYQRTLVISGIGEPVDDHAIEMINDKQIFLLSFFCLSLFGFYYCFYIAILLCYC
jgi:hypothetical protein